MGGRIAVRVLTKRADFLRLNRGHKYITDHLIFRALPQLEKLEACRIGYTVTTKCGNAVLRNRIKRRLRAVARELLPQLGQAGADYVLIARAEAAEKTISVPLDQLRLEFSKAIAALGRKMQP